MIILIHMTEGKDMKFCISAHNFMAMVCRFPSIVWTQGWRGSTFSCRNVSRRRWPQALRHGLFSEWEMGLRCRRCAVGSPFPRFDNGRAVTDYNGDLITLSLAHRFRAERGFGRASMVMIHLSPQPKGSYESTGQLLKKILISKRGFNLMSEHQRITKKE